MANPFTAKSSEGFAENLSQLDALGLLANTWEAARDEYLGIDDFRRMLQKGAKGDFAGALKSALTGGLELGTTLIPGLGVAKLGKVAANAPKAAKFLKFLGAGAKTPLRGVGQNLGVGLGMQAGMAGVGGALGKVLRRGAAPVMAASSMRPMYDPYASLRYLTGGQTSPDLNALAYLAQQGGL